MPENPDPASSVTGAFVRHLGASLADGSFIRLALSSPTPDAGALERVIGRLITLRGEPTLSLTLREAQRDRTENLPLPAAARWFASRLGREFRAALLETTSRDWQLSLALGRKPRLVAHAPRVHSAPARTHDRPIHSALEASARDWLVALGLVDDHGRVRSARIDKHQQILRYAEILGHLIDEAGWPQGASLNVADMGCGKGFLTFAAWQLLRRQRGFGGAVTGIETRPELAAEANALANNLALDGLRFVPGDIATAPTGPLDLLIALHACNTATDDAIRRGIESGARLILVAPCCHQQVRPQLGRPAPLAPILEHGIMAERAAEWVTDGLRLEFLQWAGYRTKAVEFIGSEHTPKNLLIAGVRIRPPFSDPALRERILALKQFYGLQEHALDPLLAS